MTELKHLNDSLFNEFTRLLGADFLDGFNNYYNTNYPVFDTFKDKENNFFIEFAVPGIPKENISVEFIKSSGILRVRSDYKNEEDQNKEYIRGKKIAKRKFVLDLAIPQSHAIDEDNIKIDNGILTVRLIPKKDEIQKLTIL